MPSITLASTLRAALKDVELTAKDGAAVQLAKEYAKRIDAGEDAVKLGPAYLACLESLGMTPRARAAITGKGAAPDVGGQRPLDQLRARRATRANHPATEHAATR